MKKILYVEDDEDTADAAKMILELAGFKVDVAFTGKAGLHMIAHNSYDLVLLDIMMPDMSGWDLFQKVKSVPMKFAFLSALPVSNERLAQLKKAGLSDYIMKPFSKESLTKSVKALVK